MTRDQFVQHCHANSDPRSMLGVSITLDQQMSSPSTTAAIQAASSNAVVSTTAFITANGVQPESENVPSSAGAVDPLEVVVDHPNGSPGDDGDATIAKARDIYELMFDSFIRYNVAPVQLVQSNKDRDAVLSLNELLNIASLFSTSGDDDKLELAYQLFNFKAHNTSSPLDTHNTGSDVAASAFGDGTTPATPGTPVSSAFQQGKQFTAPPAAQQRSPVPPTSTVPLGLTFDSIRVVMEAIYEEFVHPPNRQLLQLLPEHMRTPEACARHVMDQFNNTNNNSSQHSSRLDIAESESLYEHLRVDKFSFMAKAKTNLIQSRQQMQQQSQQRHRQRNDYINGENLMLTLPTTPPRRSMMNGFDLSSSSSMRSIPFTTLAVPSAAVGEHNNQQSHSDGIYEEGSVEVSISSDDIDAEEENAE